MGDYRESMRRIGITLALLMSACSIHDQAEPQANQEILRAEVRLAEALNALDVPVLDELWSERLVFTAPNGHSSTKAQRLKIVQQAKQSPSGQMTSTNDDVRVVVLGSSAVAYVVSSWHGTDGAPQPYRATHVWARENGSWRLVSAHVSKIAP
jgi:ketosteroid isomerase-like protein